MLNTPLLLPGANKWRHGWLSRFHQAVGLDQEELALSESKEGLATLDISASAQHFFHCLLLC